MRHSKLNLNLLNTVLILGFGLITSACNTGFKVDTSQSIAQNSPSRAEANQENNCTLSGPSQVVLGAQEELKLSSNFVAPANSQILWSGTNNGLQLQESAQIFSSVNTWPLNYSEPQNAGHFTRKVTVLASNGQTICETNTIEFTLVNASNADLNCVKLGGKLENSSNNFQTCAVEAWSLYRKMSDLNLVRISQSNGGADPSSINCADIGGIQHQTGSGPDGICRVDKMTLLQNVNIL